MTKRKSKSSTVLPPIVIATEEARRLNALAHSNMTLFPREAVFPGLFGLLTRSQRPSCPSEYSIHSPSMSVACAHVQPTRFISRAGTRRRLGCWR
jgi:hypothetical protein